MTLTAGSASIRSNSPKSTSRSPGCSRFKCLGRLRRMMARAPSISSNGALAVPAASDMVSPLFIFQLAPPGFGVDGLGHIRMPRHQHAEVHEIEHQEPRHPLGGDIGGA